MNPFIPLKAADIVIIHGQVSSEIINNLKKLKVKTIIPTIKCDSVDDSISYHPDIVIHPINNNTLIISPEVYDYYYERLNGMGIKLIKGHTLLQKRYPMDIAYNVGRVNRFAFHKLEYTDSVLKSHLINENINLVNTKQGYSKCSMAVINETSIITADKNIYLKLLDLQFDALLIASGHIVLEKQKYGFFGGAIGNFSPDRVLFSGHIEDHPDQIRIKSFITQRKIEIVYLSKDRICDIGTIICLNSE